MQRRRFGRTGFEGSVLVYGAAMLSDVDQDTADASVQEALDAGITSFDTAASYGASEERLRPWADRLASPDVFLATKVEERGYEAAWASIERSLARLGVDRVDLLQVHAVGEAEELDRVTGPRSATSGALEAVLRAHAEGLTRFVGITGHGHAAPAVHREALRRHDFDTVLSPWNHLLARRPDYAAEFHGLVADCEAREVGLRTIKTVSRRLWPDGAERTYTTWYEPWDDPEHVDAAVAFALAEPGVHAIASPGDVRLLAATVRAVERVGTATALGADDADRLLSGAAGYASPFASAPDGG